MDSKNQLLADMLINRNLNLAITSNEPRSSYLFNNLRNHCNVICEINFDEIDFITKYLAAFLSFKLPRAEWWGNYQMHPLIQRRRRKIFQKKIVPYVEKVDAIVMWGSWFNPDLSLRDNNIPFFHYIDQSRSLRPVMGEPNTSERCRKSSYLLQVETYAHCSGIFCMSEWARDQTISSHNVPKDKLHVVGWGPCGVNLANETINDHLRKPIILHISNDFNRKGVDYLVETAKLVKQHVPQAVFLVIGKDDNFTSREVPNNVKFMGPIHDKQQLCQFFREASLFFLPHRFDRNPHVLIEAMSARLPLVASEQGGAIELIKGNSTGFLVHPGDVRGYADAIIKLLTDQSLRISMGNTGRELMLNKYTWDIISRKIVKMIMLTLSKSSQSIKG